LKPKALILERSRQDHTTSFHLKRRKRSGTLARESASGSRRSLRWFGQAVHCHLVRSHSAFAKAAKDYRERYEELTGCSLWQCPVCHQGRMLVIEILPRSPHRKTAIPDTS
jgi:hypothetical protein